MSGGLEGISGSSDAMDELDLVCSAVWGTLAAVGTEVTALRDRKVVVPPLAPAPNVGPLKIEIKAAQDKSATSVTKLGSFLRLFAKTALNQVSATEAEIKHLALRAQPQKMADLPRWHRTTGLAPTWHLTTGLAPT